MRREINCMSCGYTTDINIHGWDHYPEREVYCPVCSCLQDEIVYDEEED